MKTYKVFAINPGSTSTKIALFKNEQSLFSKNITHKAEELAAFQEINDQLAYRRDIILNAVKEAGYTLEGTDAFVGRGGGFQTVSGGTYAVNEQMLKDVRAGITAKHPANLGIQIADEFAKHFGGVSYTVNSPTVDEFQLVARITGFCDVFRESRLHALNQKEVGIRYATQIGRKYADLNLVIAHIGGGVSITAHRKGRMVDSNDIINGDGPMAPTRSGTIPAVKLMRLCMSGKYTEHELYARLTKGGGLIDHLGTSEAKEVGDRVDNGDAHAKLIYDAMIYQIAKSIGAYSTVLKGNVDAIILTGGIARSKYVVDQITDMTKYIASIAVMPGEFEMEALAAGALRVLRGEEIVLEYTGVPVWNSCDSPALSKR